MAIGLVSYGGTYQRRPVATEGMNAAQRIAPTFFRPQHSIRSTMSNSALHDSNMDHVTTADSQRTIAVIVDVVAPPSHIPLTSSTCDVIVSRAPTASHKVSLINDDAF